MFDLLPLSAISKDVILVNVSTKCFLYCAEINTFLIKG